MWVIRSKRVKSEAILRLLRNSLLVSFISLLYTAVSLGQESARESNPGVRVQVDSAHTPAITPLEDLLKEAERNNPSIQAARQGWQAAQQVPTQVSTRPDPQFTVQHFSVGSPRPFAGYSNSEFAYIGLGVSQDFPYPGKLRLRGEVAKREADVILQRYESVRRSVLVGIKSAYFQLGYLSRTLAILESDGELLQQVEKAAEARYRSGMGNQQDLLQEITMHHLEVAKLQAQIKQLLNRGQSSPDIEPADLSETPLEYSFEQLLSATKTQNPEISGAGKMVERQ